MFDDHKALKPGNTISRINHLTAAGAANPRSCRDRIVEASVIAAKKNAGGLRQGPVPDFTALRRGRGRFGVGLAGTLSDCRGFNCGF